MSDIPHKYDILQKIKAAQSDDDILKILVEWEDQLRSRSYLAGRDSILVDIEKTGELPPNVRNITEPHKH